MHSLLAWLENKECFQAGVFRFLVCILETASDKIPGVTSSPLSLAEIGDEFHPEQGDVVATGLQWPEEQRGAEWGQKTSEDGFVPRSCDQHAEPRNRLWAK